MRGQLVKRELLARLQLEKISWLRCNWAAEKVNGNKDSSLGCANGEVTYQKGRGRSGTKWQWSDGMWEILHSSKLRMWTCCQLLHKDVKCGLFTDKHGKRDCGERKRGHSLFSRLVGINAERRGHRLHWLFKQQGLHVEIHHDEWLEAWDTWGISSNSFSQDERWSRFQESS